MKLIVSGGLIALVLLFWGVAASATAVATPALPAISGLHSPSHPDPTHWYADRQASFAWTPAVGVSGYSYVLDQNPATVPDTTIDLAAVSFAAKTDHVTGAGPHGVAVGDFDSDGKPDLAVANYGSNNVGVLLGNGGGFDAGTDYATGGHPFSVAVGDFNKDGLPDLVTANWSDNTVSVLFGNGADGFGAKTDYATGIEPSSVTVGDFNADGKADLAVAAHGSNFVSPLLGNGTSGFGGLTDSYATGTEPCSVAVGDFNGDGVPDLAVANRGSGTVSVLLIHAIFGFAGRTDYATGSHPFSVAVGDFNNDGALDLAVADSSADTVSVLLGDGAGGFGAKTDYATGITPYSVAVGDFNKDGVLDLAVANVSSNTVSVLLGNGTGGFGANIDFATGANPLSVAVGDFDSDGKADLAVANYSDNTVSVLRNTTAAEATETATADGVWYFHVRTVDGLGNGGPTATLAVKIDADPPATTDNGPAGWVNHAVAVILTAGDGTGSGVASTQFELDSATSWSTYSDPILVSGDGEHTLSYRSTDNAGNTEATKSCTVKVDIGIPSTIANAATVKSKKKVALKFSVIDPTPSCGSATVTIQIKRGSKVVKNLAVGKKATNTALTYKWKAALKKGSYTYSVLATDAAGNQATSIGSAKLTVK